MGDSLQHIYISHKHLVAWSQIFAEKIKEIAELILLGRFPRGRGISKSLLCLGLGAYTALGICKGSFGSCYLILLNTYKHLGIASCRTYYP